MFEQTAEGVVDGITGEERGEGTALDTENERWRVDEEIVSRRENGDRRAAELHALARVYRSALDATLRERGGP